MSPLVMGTKSILLFRNGIALGTNMFNSSALGLALSCERLGFCFQLWQRKKICVLTVANGVSHCIIYIRQ